MMQILTSIKWFNHQHPYWALLIYTGMAASFLGFLSNIHQLSWYNFIGTSLFYYAIGFMFTAIGYAIDR